MNKKIVVSLAVIGVVAVIAIGATIAYFSDTETSANNMFVAGTIDLKVDHRMQSYNGAECHTCGLTLLSSTEDIVEETGAHAVKSWVHSNWDHTLQAQGADWIWKTYKVEDPSANEAYTFKREFNWTGATTGATLKLALAADNRVRVTFNDVVVYEMLTEHNYEAPVSINLTNVVQGNNKLEIWVQNIAIQGSTPTQNPAALIYKLEIGGECSPKFLATCKLWYEPKDLSENDKFFDFDDIKPGDYGRNVISLHVESNDAYMCLSTKNVTNDENTVVEPEQKMGDDATTGELGANIHLYVWMDENGDGFMQSTERKIAENITLNDLHNYTLYDKTTGAFIAGQTKFLGIAWCAGTMAPNTDGTFLCDGSTMDNLSQSDIFSAALEFFAEQQRNNDGFSCSQAPTQG